MEGGSAPADHAGWMWDLTVQEDHDFYVEPATCGTFCCPAGPACGRERRKNTCRAPSRFHARSYRASASSPAGLSSLVRREVVGD